MNLTLSSHDPALFSVVESSQVGEARRAAERLAEGLGFGEVERGQVAIAVTELASNLSRHGRGGELVIRSLAAAGAPGIELLSIDRGPGIPNVTEALRDGFSTAGTAGTGLGAVQRLSSVFEVFTSPPSGTVLVSRFYAGAAPAGTDELPVGVVCLPKKGEPACGDAWHVEETGGGRTVVLVADGLGHGLHAADASRLAVKLFRENLHLDTARIVTAIHGGLRSTRGAAVAVVELLRGQGAARFTGVGNVSASILTGDVSRSMVSHNGTAGAEARRIQEFTYAWAEDALLVMHSDGLGSQWQLGKYPGLRFRHPSLIAGVLYRDFRRERDDVTVLVVGGATTA